MHGLTKNNLKYAQSGLFDLDKPIKDYSTEEYNLLKLFDLLVSRVGKVRKYILSLFPEEKPLIHSGLSIRY